MNYPATILLDVAAEFVCGPNKSTRPAHHEGQEAENICKIERSIAYMTRQLERRLRVAGLAAQAGISPSHYFALFKRHTGLTPIDFFIHLKMRRACELLDETSLNVKEVAAALGYDDQFYFSRVFKSAVRFAPTEYRLLAEELKQQLWQAVRSKGRLIPIERREKEGECLNGCWLVPATGQRMVFMRFQGEGCE